MCARAPLRVLAVMAMAIAAIATLPPRARAQDKKFWAVLVGVSKFQKLDAAQQLEYADKDAEAFAKFIQSPRGRAFPKENIKLLLNQDATNAQLRTALASWLKRSSKAEDVIYIFLATHGMVDKEEPRRTYLLTNEADPEDLYDTTMSMNDLSDIISNRLKNVGRIVLFADACRSGKLGAGIGGDIQKGASGNQELVGLLASRAREFSQEGKQFCNGHGAFTCFLLKGLDGAADTDKDGTVTAGELIKYLRDQVAKATSDKQNPQEFGEFDPGLPMAFADKPGIDLGIADLFSPWRKLPELLASLQAGLNLPITFMRYDFQQAIKDQRLLPPKIQNAWEQYQQMVKSNIPKAELENTRDELAVALEEEGQKVVQTYLRGDASPLSAADYRIGEQCFARAASLNPEEKKLRAKERFCAGRALLLEDRPREAEFVLREAVQIDPQGPYSHNALGIVYTQLRRIDEAEKEFRAAFDGAPHWAYPHYNLAFAYTKVDRFREAEAEYKAAIERGPKYAYIYVNLGELYQNRLHRQEDAEKAYRKAIELNPGDPYAYNMLGLLLKDRGDLAKAEAAFRDGIKADPKTVKVRVNLALLLIDRNRKDEAEQVLREAVTLAGTNPQPHLELGDLLADRGKLDEAEAEYLFVAAAQPTDLRVLESLGDLHFKEKRYDEASREYRLAIANASDAAVKSRLDKKAKAAEKAK
jgi:Flp pilus assembly protein TadD